MMWFCSFFLNNSNSTCLNPDHCLFLLYLACDVKDVCLPEALFICKCKHRFLSHTSLLDCHFWLWDERQGSHQKRLFLHKGWPWYSKPHRWEPGEKYSKNVIYIFAVFLCLTIFGKITVHRFMLPSFFVRCQSSSQNAFLSRSSGSTGKRRKLILKSWQMLKLSLETVAERMALR